MPPSRTARTALTAIVLLITNGSLLVACSNNNQKRRQPATLHLPRATSPRYLNDGDKDPSTDEDGDDINGRKADADHDYRDDHRPHGTENYHDYDDNVVNWGQAANPAETRAVSAAVEHYLAVAATGDGTAACKLMDAVLAEELAEDYSQSGPAYVKGRTTCATVMSALLHHEQLRTRGRLHVTEVRVKERRAIALLGSQTTPASYITMRREGKQWKADAINRRPLS